MTASNLRVLSYQQGSGYLSHSGHDRVLQASVSKQEHNEVGCAYCGEAASLMSKFRVAKQPAPSQLTQLPRDATGRLSVGESLEALGAGLLNGAAEVGTIATLFSYQ